NGQAPNRPATGSQLESVRNARPNVSIDDRDWNHNTTPMAATRTTMRTAGVAVSQPKARSAADVVRPLMSVDPNAFEGPHFLLDDGSGQRRVAELGRIPLAVGERPPHDLDHGARLHRIGWLFVEEQPCERGDWVGVGAGRVRDRYAKVVGHVRG